jgi:hypothetical protein
MGLIPTPLVASKKPIHHVVFGILTVERKSRSPRAVMIVSKSSGSASFTIGQAYKLGEYFHFVLGRFVIGSLVGN